MDNVARAIFSILNYYPWPTQDKFHSSEARFRSLFAGSRYGKSLAASKEVVRLIFTEHGNWPDYRIWMVGSSYDQPSKEFRYVIADMIKLGYFPKKHLNLNYTTPGPQTAFWDFKPYGTVELYTKSEQNPESLLGEEINVLVLSEGSRLKEETYDSYLRQRLGSRRGKVLVPTTPHGYNWIYKRFYLPTIEKDPLYWSAIVPVTENERFPKEEYERARKELPEEIFKEQYDGEFVAYTGLIYKRFSYQHNVISPIQIPKDWRHYMSIDPHPQTPSAVLWTAMDHHGTIYLYDEMFIPDKTIPELARLIGIKEDKRIEYRRLIDPNAKYIDKLRGQTASIQQQLRSEGIYCVEADNKFESAFYRISEMLTPTAVYGNEETKAAKMFVFNDLKETIHEFTSCDWETEKDNHMLDNVKYIVNDIPKEQHWTEEELAQEEETEYSIMQSRNPRTGY